MVITHDVKMILDNRLVLHDVPLDLHADLTSRLTFENPTCIEINPHPRGAGATRTGRPLGVAPRPTN
jgi:hypothetical protein